MKKRTLNLVPKTALPDAEYVPPSEMYPGTANHMCERCHGPLVNGNPVFFLSTDVRIYHFHRECPAEEPYE